MKTTSKNAKYLTYKEVSESFVVNRQFRQLIINDSSIIVGPRGCGKTTLLKMLYPLAYHANTSDKLRKLYDEMPFWGIYIPADTEWKEQLEMIRKSDSEYSENLVITLISINILSSIVQCFGDLLQISRDLAKESSKCDITISDIDDIEISLAKDLIKNWRMPTTVVPTLYEIVQYWTVMTYDIGSMLESNKYNGPIFDGYSYFMNYAKSAFNAFEQHCSRLSFCAKKNFRWALCFDELEILPENFRQHIYKLLRSSLQNVLYKTTSAYLLSDLPDSPTDAAEGQDYSEIFNWVYGEESQKEWQSFCKELFNKKINGFSKLVGEYDLLKGVKKTSYDGKDYIKGSPTYDIFTELASKDTSFNNSLKQKGIDPQDPYLEQQKEWLKKVKTVAICRWYHLKNREMSPFYFGEELLYDISEGNPRLAIKILDEIFLEYNKQNGKKTAISPERQSDIIIFLSKKKKRFLENYPNAVIEKDNKRFSLGDLINIIGSYFSQELYGDTFQEFPKNTFCYDDRCESILPLIKIGLELGAFIKLQTKESREQVYKLSYILYPCFNLPRRATVTKYAYLFDILYPHKSNEDQTKLDLQ